MPNPEEIGLPSDGEDSTVSSSGLPAPDGAPITDGLPVTNGGSELNPREGEESEENPEEEDADAMFQSVPIHNYPPPPGPQA